MMPIPNIDMGNFLKDWGVSIPNPANKKEKLPALHFKATPVPLASKSLLQKIGCFLLQIFCCCFSCCETEDLDDLEAKVISTPVPPLTGDKLDIFNENLREKLDVQIKRLDNDATLNFAKTVNKTVNEHVATLAFPLADRSLAALLDLAEHYAATRLMVELTKTQNKELRRYLEQECDLLKHNLKELDQSIEGIHALEEKINQLRKPFFVEENWVFLGREEINVKRDEIRNEIQRLRDTLGTQFDRDQVRLKKALEDAKKSLGSSLPEILQVLVDDVYRQGSDLLEKRKDLGPLQATELEKNDAEIEKKVAQLIAHKEDYDFFLRESRAFSAEWQSLTSNISEASVLNEKVMEQTKTEEAKERFQERLALFPFANRDEIGSWELNLSELIANARTFLEKRDEALSRWDWVRKSLTDSIPEEIEYLHQSEIKLLQHFSSFPYLDSKAISDWVKALSKFLDDKIAAFSLDKEVSDLYVDLQNKVETQSQKIKQLRNDIYEGLVYFSPILSHKLQNRLNELEYRYFTLKLVLDSLLTKGVEEEIWNQIIDWSPGSEKVVERLKATRTSGRRTILDWNALADALVKPRLEELQVLYADATNTTQDLQGVERDAYSKYVQLEKKKNNLSSETAKHAITLWQSAILHKLVECRNSNGDLGALKTAIQALCESYTLPLNHASGLSGDELLIRPLTSRIHQVLAGIKNTRQSSQWTLLANSVQKDLEQAFSNYQGMSKVDENSIEKLEKWASRMEERIAYAEQLKSRLDKEQNRVPIPTLIRLEFNEFRKKFGGSQQTTLNTIQQFIPKVEKKSLLNQWLPFTRSIEDQKIRVKEARKQIDFLEYCTGLMLDLTQEVQQAADMREIRDLPFSQFTQYSRKHLECLFRRFGQNNAEFHFSKNFDCPQMSFTEVQEGFKAEGLAELEDHATKSAKDLLAQTKALLSERQKSVDLKPLLERFNCLLTGLSGLNKETLEKDWKQFHEQFLLTKVKGQLFHFTRENCDESMKSYREELKNFKYFGEEIEDRFCASFERFLEKLLDSSFKKLKNTEQNACLQSWRRECMNEHLNLVKESRKGIEAVFVGYALTEEVDETDDLLIQQRHRLDLLRKMSGALNGLRLYGVLKISEKELEQFEEKLNRELNADLELDRLLHLLFGLAEGKVYEEWHDLQLRIHDFFENGSLSLQRKERLLEQRISLELESKNLHLRHEDAIDEWKNLSLESIGNTQSKLAVLTESAQEYLHDIEERLDVLDSGEMTEALKEAQRVLQEENNIETTKVLLRRLIDRSEKSGWYPLAIDLYRVYLNVDSHRGPQILDYIVSSKYLQNLSRNESNVTNLSTLISRWEALAEKVSDFIDMNPKDLTEQHIDGFLCENECSEADRLWFYQSKRYLSSITEKVSKISENSVLNLKSQLDQLYLQICDLEREHKEEKKKIRNLQEQVDLLRHELNFSDASSLYGALQRKGILNRLKNTMEQIAKEANRAVRNIETELQGQYTYKVVKTYTVL